jgi:hypothetical protein
MARKIDFSRRSRGGRSNSAAAEGEDDRFQPQMMADDRFQPPLMARTIDFSRPAPDDEDDRSAAADGGDD